jgi:hypothetical protein
LGAVVEILYRFFGIFAVKNKCNASSLALNADKLQSSREQKGSEADAVGFDPAWRVLGGQFSVRHSHRSFCVEFWA